MQSSEDKKHFSQRRLSLQPNVEHILNDFK